MFSLTGNSNHAPGVVSEALVSGVTVFLVIGENYCNVMRQGKVLLGWIRETGVQLVVRHAKKALTVSQHQMEMMRENIRRLPNYEAVFEVHELVEEANNGH